jgi:hypothetical protein
MSALPNARRGVAEFLRGQTGSERPEWRAVFTTDGTDGPTGIAPVCTDPDHEPGDGDLYSCCPSMAIEVEWHVLAEYLVALLNADRGAGENG